MHVNSAVSIQWIRFKKNITLFSRTVSEGHFREGAMEKEILGKATILLSMLFTYTTVAMADPVVVIPLTNSTKVTNLESRLEVIERGWDTVTSAGGRVWMDRNLGALRVANGPWDEYGYGDLYQWGRLKDGHESRNSGTTTTLSVSDVPENGFYITTSSSPDDWRAGQNHNLWQGGANDNNPCPNGFRVPTITEFENEVSSWSSNNAFGAFSSPLKLPVAGARDSDGSVVNDGVSGFYWSSTTSVTNARYLFNQTSNTMTSLTIDRSTGMSIRCIQD